MGKIEKILKKGPVEGQTTEVYPVTSTKAVYDENNKRLDNIITGLQESVYLNTPIPISTENTPESKAQNVKNIADYVEKAKAAGIANVNGMAVTCLIDGGGYSGVGYLNGDTDTSICAIEIFDDSSNPMYFKVDPDGTYGEVAILMENNTDIVTSDMLVKGARKPIVITGDMTEVDEETYQKLLSDDVDVVFKTQGGDPNICILTYKYDDGDAWSFTFSCFSREGDSFSETYLYGYEVRITKTGNPHPCRVIDNAKEKVFNAILLNEGFIRRYDLTPVLQEINLTGTDADRKAKLDKFETDWKALTGTSDLNGARFVGYLCNSSGNTNSADYFGVFTYDVANAGYFSICSNINDNLLALLTIDEETGAIYITPLFSHLEAVPIETSNSSAAKIDNIHALQSYIDNLAELGVTDTLGIEIPICINGTDNYGILVGDEHTRRFKGFAYYDNIPVAISISTDGTVTISNLQTQVDNTLNTESKNITGAINEVNALVEKKVDKSLNAKSLEAVAIKTGPTPEDRAANVEAIKAYVDNLKALGVDTTKGYMIPIKTSFGNGFILFDGTKGEGYVKLNNDCYGILIAANYTVTVNNLISTATNYNSLETTSKRVLPAINEVNALAKGYSTIFTPIELTTETAQNKTAIDARVAAFTAQGISLTNGCCIPVTYKGVYAGNISLINGDWFGLLVKNTNNPADNINIKLSADGTITEGNSVQ